MGFATNLGMWVDEGGPFTRIIKVVVLVGMVSIGMNLFGKLIQRESKE